MKEIYLDIHTDRCEYKREERNKREYDSENPLLTFDICQHNPERFLFFLDNRFFLITYHHCFEDAGRYDFRKYLVEAAIKKYKIYDYYKVDKSVHYEKELKEFRLNRRALKKKITQINYVYSDNRGKKYAITTEVPYMDGLFNIEKIEESFLEMKEFLIKNNYNYLEKELDELYFNVRQFEPSDSEVIKTIDKFVELINQKTK